MSEEYWYNRFMRDVVQHRKKFKISCAFCGKEILTYEIYVNLHRKTNKRYACLKCYYKLLNDFQKQIFKKVLNEKFKIPIDEIEKLLQE